MRSFMILLLLCFLVYGQIIQQSTSGVHLSAKSVSADSLSVTDVGDVAALLLELQKKVSMLEQVTKLISSCSEAEETGLYNLGLSTGEITHCYCLVNLLGSSWTVVGRATKYPTANWLYTTTFTENVGLSVDHSIAVRHLKFKPTEMILGATSSSEEVWGAKFHASFNQTIAFYPAPHASETCTSVSCFYCPDTVAARKYGFRTSLFGETMISNRRNVDAGGIDLGCTSCDGSAELLSVYRESSTHGVAVGIANAMISSWKISPGMGVSEYADALDGQAQGLIITTGATPVWVAVRE